MCLWIQSILAVHIGIAVKDGSEAIIEKFSDYK